VDYCSLECHLLLPGAYAKLDAAFTDLHREFADHLTIDVGQASRGVDAALQ
jgi:hypothetical protein